MKILRYKAFQYITLCLILFACSHLKVYSQYKFRYDKHHLSAFRFSSNEPNGFSASVSLVALFTSGVADRSGFRLGIGLNMSYAIDYWTFDAGIDSYKSQQKFGIGTTYASIGFDNGKYGCTQYINKYHQGDKQVSGLNSLHLDNVIINFENDIFAFPFVGFRSHDRYRTAALEIRYKGFMLGMNVYTSDINGLTNASLNNSKGQYLSGKQLSSPIYVGYAKRDMIVRYGINNPKGGFFGQNIWHQHFFSSPNFKHGDYNKQFIQVGIDKPYTLY